ncbi:gp19.2 [Escherichia phage BA14]|uniref:Gp19.2 n=1 Tax=Escherichia phage BA14 TaxID=532074 RepID=B3VCS1_9CAUD|nr:gp19.2 [Escherichia phage BA14]ACF15776.1 gp19.2 [Escherichia phage BA14]
MATDWLLCLSKSMMKATRFFVDNLLTLFDSIWMTSVNVNSNMAKLATLFSSCSTLTCPMLRSTR